MEVGLAEARFWSGRWDEAADLRGPALTTSDVFRITALAILARIRARRRMSEIWPSLDEALAIAGDADELQYWGVVAAARAEACWLGGQDDRVTAELRQAFELAVAVDSSWWIGQLGWWLWRAGELTTAPRGLLPCKSTEIGKRRQKNGPPSAFRMRRRWPSSIAPTSATYAPLWTFSMGWAP